MKVIFDTRQMKKALKTLASMKHQRNYSAIKEVTLRAEKRTAADYLSVVRTAYNEYPHKVTAEITSRELVEEEGELTLDLTALTKLMSKPLERVARIEGNSYGAWLMYEDVSSHKLPVIPKEKSDDEQVKSEKTSLPIVLRSVDFCRLAQSVMHTMIPDGDRDFYRYAEMELKDDKLSLRAGTAGNATIARIKYYGDMEEEFKCTIPYNMLSVGLSVGKEAGTVEITYTSDKVKMSISGDKQEVFMVGDMHEGEFPVLEKVFEKYKEGKVRGRFGVKELTNALTSIKEIVKANYYYRICLEFVNDGLKITVRDEHDGELSAIKVVGEVQGELGQVYVDWRYMSDTLKTLKDEEEIEISTEYKLSPLRIEPVGYDGFYEYAELIMPLRNGK